MSTVLHISGGRVIDPATERDQPDGDVYAVDGKIVADLSPSQRAKAHVIDAHGCIVCPGFIDVHVHFREPGQTYKETIASGSRAAAAGGFTSVVCMPNTVPPCDNVSVIELIRSIAERKAVVNVYPTGCVTLGRLGAELAPIGSLKHAGIVAVTDDGDCVQNNEIMRRVLEYANMLDIPVMDHCQDTAMTKDAVMHEGIISLKLGLRGWPSVAEDLIVSRNILLSQSTGAHIHLQHISSATSVDLIRQAKRDTVRITAEVTPHHLALTDVALHGFGTHFKMNPPLRTEDDRRALIAGLVDGTIDLIATDHAPHSADEKDVEFDRAPFGVIGLETALSVLLEVVIKPGHCELPFLVSRLTEQPARLLRLKDKGALRPGLDADVTVFDPKASWSVTPEALYSQSQNSPWLGKTLHGKVKATIVNGRVVFEG